MVSLTTPVCDFGLPAPDFRLADAAGRSYALADLRGPRGLLVIFMCNHCPYVKAIIERLVQDCRALAAEGIGSVAIMPNDVEAYPEDAPEHMARWARELDFPFPYLFDAGQTVARAYGAVCTPDFFGYNAELQLQYRGRFDASRKTSAPGDARRELFEAMLAVARTDRGPAEQVPSMGCSIKWRDGDA